MAVRARGTAPTTGSRGDARALSIQGVSRRFGDIEALVDIDLDISHGEFVSLLGPSGCGKTTLLRIVTGFERADAGRVLFHERDITRVAPYKRPVNMVFQRYALFPHMTVGQNVAFALSISRTSRDEVTKRTAEMLRLVQLEGYEGRRPDQLSGGQAQRVALARALASHPEVLLLDEPLASLDLKLRQAMQYELRRIQEEVGATFVYVTHDQEEALTMSDRIVLMNAGRIEQIGTPLQVYRNPETRFVAQFIGDVNLFDGNVALVQHEHDGRSKVVVDAASFKIRVPTHRRVKAGDSVWVSVRPESVSIERASRAIDVTKSENCTQGRLVDTTFLGPYVRYRVGLADGRLLLAQSDSNLTEGELKEGDTVLLRWHSESGTLLCN